MRISDWSSDVGSSDLILARKSLTVLARIGSGNIAAVCFYDDLSAAEGEGGIKFLADNVVPPGAQIVDQRRVSAGFDADPAAGIDPPARCIGGRLRVLAIAQNPKCKLQMALRLNGAAHQPERHQRITIQVHGKSRDDRVEGALSQTGRAAGWEKR